MKTYAIYHRSRSPAGVLAEPDGAVFVKEGPAWVALFIPVLWALWNQLWLVTAGIVALELMLAGIGKITSLPATTMVPISLLLNLLIALEGNELRRWTLERRGYGLVGLVTAPSPYEAELIYFERLLNEKQPETRAPSAIPAALKLAASPADNSLFPASGA
ncbi:MAG: DUF2628 domain-containing protein [Alphaproteobacteria bacterium]|nr:DUF2628 domain-containing protein [Alphaproteobacteria bacterium]